MYTEAEVLQAIEEARGSWDWEVSTVVLRGALIPVKTEHTTDAPGWDYTGRVYIHYTIGDQTFTKEGMNRSHEGTEWDYGDFYESTPATFEVTKYVRKN